MPKTKISLDQWQRDTSKKHKEIKYRMIFTGEEQEGYRVVSACEAYNGSEIDFVDIYIF